MCLGWETITADHEDDHDDNLVGTGVEVSVVFRQQVHIMEDDTGPVKVLHGLHEADVHELPPVERLLVALVDEVEPVVKAGLSPGGWEHEEYSHTIIQPYSHTAIQPKIVEKHC